MARIPDEIPSGFPYLSARWKSYCDTNPEVQTFINNHPYIKATDPVNRKYLFCYAEFILKTYAIRYGDLINAWCFDSADNIMEECGDDAASGILNDQRIYEAFANACHAGNPNAAIAFNNSTGDRDGVPFSTATLFDDYSFGHPFGGAGNMVETEALYNANFGVCEYMHDTNGHSFTSDNRTWNNNVVGHFFPKQSSTSWNAGAKACLTDAQFVEWNSVGLINGGAITWGTPLERTNLINSPILTLQPYALNQLALTDTHLKEFQSPGAPNWSRQYTILPPAHIGQPYSHTLTVGFDFWDPEGDAITSLLALDSFPAWLTITETASGVWTLSGTPTETTATDYEFKLQVKSASLGTDRTVELKVLNDFVPEPTTMDVQIKATANTNYGIGTKAVMYSAIQTAPDGLATFRVSMDVTPPSGKAVISGISGGTSTVNSWAIGDGTDSDQDDIFRGSDNEWVESINKIQIIDFNANGGTLTPNSTASIFKSVTIVNAQSSGKDDVSLKVGGVTSNLGKLANITQEVNLESATAVTNITDFSIGVGNALDTNKWSIEGVTVTVVFDEKSLSVLNPEIDNTEPFRLYPNPAQHKIFLNTPIHSVIIMDVSGRIIKRYSEKIENLDISDLASGVYILKGISDQDVMLVKRFVKSSK